MNRRSFFRDDQLAGDLAIGVSARHQQRNLALTRGEVASPSRYTWG